MSPKPRILCVDDEPRVLEGLALHLRRGFDMAAAGSASEGLAWIEKHGPPEVVLSDMRMPGMDGAAFLAAVKAQWPDTTRLLLTGQSDIEAASQAVNQGGIFRFLLKPCPPGQLVDALDAAVRQTRLVTAEKVMLEQTLKGAIQALTSLLALASPAAMSRAERLRRTCRSLAAKLQLPEAWQLDMAAQLSQVAAVTLAPETAEKLHHGQALSPEELESVKRLPALTEKLLEPIPRLEGVREILRVAYATSEPGAVGIAVGGKPASAEVLRMVLEFDELTTRALSPSQAVDTLRGRETYSDEWLAVLAEVSGASRLRESVREVSIKDLVAGMILVQDVRLSNGMLLVAHGFEVNASFIERLSNYSDGQVGEPLLVSDAE